MSPLDEMLHTHGGRSPIEARATLGRIAEVYAARARSIGYTPLVGAATVSGLLGVLALASNGEGTINADRLPDELVEAFRLQYPNVFESGGLDQLTLESAQGYLNGWSGKYTEILMRDTLNSGGSLGSVSLSPGETAVLADDPTQAMWDMRIEPTGRLLQVKATDSVAYVRETMQDLDGTGIDVLSTDLPDFEHGTSVQLMEMAMSKDEIDAFIDGALADSVGDVELGDVLGVFALLFTAGTTFILMKKLRDDLRRGASARALYRTYGPGVIGKAINLASPIPFSGLFAARWLRGRVMLEEAATTVRDRIKRADVLLAQMHATSRGHRI